MPFTTRLPKVRYHSEHFDEWTWVCYHQAPPWVRVVAHVGDAGQAQPHLEHNPLSLRSYWIPGSYAPTWSEKRTSLFKAIEKEGLQGGQGDNNWVVRHRQIHDPGIQQEPQLIGTLGAIAFTGDQ